MGTYRAGYVTPEPLSEEASTLGITVAFLQRYGGWPSVVQYDGHGWKFVAIKLDTDGDITHVVYRDDVTGQILNVWND